jgi:hypothetical protein
MEKGIERMKKEQVEATKSTEVYLSNGAYYRRSINLALRMFLVWFFIGYISKSSDLHSMFIILSIPSFFIGFCVCIKGVKIRSNNSIIYQGSLGDLIKELYIYGFALNEKIGELYAFRTHYFLFKKTILVKSGGSGCELFGDYPKELSAQVNNQEISA